MNDVTPPLHVGRLDPNAFQLELEPDMKGDNQFPVGRLPHGDTRPYHPPPSTSSEPVEQKTLFRGWGVLLTALVLLLAAIMGSRIHAVYLDLYQVHIVWAGLYVAALGIAASAIVLIASLKYREYAALPDVSRLQSLFEQKQSSPPETLQRELTKLLSYWETQVEWRGGPLDDLKNLLKRPITRDEVKESVDRILKPLDIAAAQEIDQTVKRVAISTALASRSFDAMIVANQSLYLTGRLATLYGGRTTKVGLAKLLIRAVSHMAASEVLDLGVQSVGLLVTNGALAKLGARVAEGAANGMLMIRFGEAVRACCRPIAPQPFAVASVPGRVRSILKGSLLKIGAKRRLNSFPA